MQLLLIKLLNYVYKKKILIYVKVRVHIYINTIFYKIFKQLQEFAKRFSFSPIFPFFQTALS